MVKIPALILYLLLLPTELWAEDIVRMTIRDPITDGYQQQIIDAALSHSVEKYGQYQLIVDHVDVSSKRSFAELNNGEGKLFNLRIALTSKSREKDALTIRIPLTKGLQNYRLLIVKKGDTERFKHVKTINDLKKLNIGLLYDWMTTEIMAENNFDIVKSPSYSGMFRMLSAQRFDYTILGVNKVYSFMTTKGEWDEKFSVVPGVVLYINGPSYVFVSKKHPRVAERIEWGFEKMIINGEFERIFNKYHQVYIDNADLASRKIINIPNKRLPDTVPLTRKNLWISL